MKKTFLCIISIFLFFSIENTQASYSLEDMYNINLESNNTYFSDIKIDYFNFANSENQYRYSLIKNAAEVIKKSIILKYENNDIDYYDFYTVRRNYSDYVYYTNEYLNNLLLLEKYSYLKETFDYKYSQEQIEEGLRNSIRDIKRTLK